MRSLGSAQSPSVCTSDDTSPSAAPPGPCGLQGDRCGIPELGFQVENRPSDPGEEENKAELRF